jgi:hypothetical protein
MVRSYQLTLAAAAQRLSDVYGGTPGAKDDRTDIPYRQILLSASGGDAFLGDDAATTSTEYGIDVSADVTVPVSIGPFETGPVKLSDLYAAGAGSTLHILAIPF